MDLSLPTLLPNMQSPFGTLDFGGFGGVFLLHDEGGPTKPFLRSEFGPTRCFRLHPVSPLRRSCPGLPKTVQRQQMDPDGRSSTLRSLYGHRNFQEGYRDVFVPTDLVVDALVEADELKEEERPHSCLGLLEAADGTEYVVHPAGSDFSDLYLFDARSIHNSFASQPSAPGALSVAQVEVSGRDLSMKYPLVGTVRGQQTVDIYCIRDHDNLPYPEWYEVDKFVFEQPLARLRWSHTLMDAAIAGKDGKICLWDGLSSRMVPLSQHKGEELASEWGKCVDIIFGSSAREMVMCLERQLVRIDARTRFRPVPLTAPSVEVDRFVALTPHHSHPFQLVASSQSFLSIYDCRYSKCPLLSWRHHQDGSAPSMMMSMPATAAATPSEDQSNSAFVLTGSTVEKTILLYQYAWKRGNVESSPAASHAMVGLGTPKLLQSFCRREESSCLSEPQLVGLNAKWTPSTDSGTGDNALLTVYQLASNGQLLSQTFSGVSGDESEYHVCEESKVELSEDSDEDAEKKLRPSSHYDVTNVLQRCVDDEPTEYPQSHAQWGYTKGRGRCDHSQSDAVDAFLNKLGTAWDNFRSTNSASGIGEGDADGIGNDVNISDSAQRSASGSQISSQARKSGGGSPPRASHRVSFADSVPMSAPTKRKPMKKRKHGF